MGGLEELAAVVQNQKVISFLEQPEINTSEKVNVLAELVELKSDELKNFITVLAEQKRLPVFA